MGKLPYIPNKKLYAAVMGACSYIRETGYFNKATSYYADKYDVDIEDVKKYVRIAQGNGQKAAPKRKYKWYVLIILKDYYCVGYGCDGEYSSWDWTEEEKHSATKVCIKRATTEINAKKQCDLHPDFKTWERFETSHSENIVKFCKEFKSKDEAEDFAKQITWDFAKEYVLGR